MNPQEIAVFRASAAKHPGVPLPEFCDLREDPDEPAQKTYLMRIACELLLRMWSLDVCKKIVAAQVLDLPDEWFQPLREAISFVEAEDRGELIVPLKEITVRKLPVDDIKRLNAVGTALFGARYRRQLAKACGVSPALVDKWPPMREGLLNQYLLAAVRSEEAALLQRKKVLTGLRSQLSQPPGRGE
jgi:hypothetical protein